MDGLESESQDNRSQPVSPGDFQEALSLRSLPIPDYTSADIMAEEAANQTEASPAKSGAGRSQSGEELVSIARIIPLGAAALLLLMPGAARAEIAVRLTLLKPPAS